MKSSNGIGFGIIGLGMIAEFHAKAIENIEGCKFVAGYDHTPAHSESFCALHGGTPYTDLENFLADPNIDIVTIATPSGFHLEGAVRAANAGKHIIVEKPLEISTERCDKIIEAVVKNNVRMCTVFPSRFHDSARLIKEAVRQGRLGKIVLADAQIKWYRSQEYYDSGGWRGTWKFDGGGVLMNQGIHAIDLLQWVMGSVSEVTAYTATLAHERIEVEDTAVAILKFSDGALGMIEGTTAAYPGFLKKLEICGSKGSVMMEEESITKWEFAEPMPEDQKIREQFQNNTQTGGGAGDPKAISFEGHRKLFSAFVDAIIQNKPFDLEGVEGRKSVEIIENIYKSAKNGIPVKFES